METKTQVKSNNLSERVGNKVRSIGAIEKFPFFVKASDTKNLQKSKKVNFISTTGKYFFNIVLCYRLTQAHSVLNTFRHGGVLTHKPMNYVTKLFK